jgi:hypothetical protein
MVGMPAEVMAVTMESRREKKGRRIGNATPFFYD